MRSTAMIAALCTVVGVLDLGADLANANRGGRQEGSVEDHPFTGHWAANVSKSKLSPVNTFQSATLQISVGAGTITMASRIVTSSGQEQRAAETFRTDGTETPGTLTPGVVLVARWLDPHVLATLAKKDGQVLALVTYEVSADRKTLTSRSSGVLEQVIMFDRQ